MSDYIKNGVYYSIDAANSELKRMPYAFLVKRDGDNPFAENMIAGAYTCSSWGREAHTDVNYKSAIGWDKIPKGVEYYIIGDTKNAYAVTADYARENYEFLFSSGQIRSMICNVAEEVFHSARTDAWGDADVEEIDVDMTMEEASEWDEEHA